MITRQDIRDIVEPWLEQLEHVRFIPDVLYTCSKCGMSFGRITMYSCQNNGCPVFAQATMTVEYTEVKLLSYEAR